MGVGIDSIPGALALFGAGLATGWLTPWRRRPTRPLIGAESPEESLARLQASRVPMKGGQRLMGPQQPRPQVQSRIPSAPPRGRLGDTITPVTLAAGWPPGLRLERRRSDAVSPTDAWRGRPHGMPSGILPPQGGSGQARARD